MVDAAVEVPFDVFEEILKRLVIKDLIKCKSVCKSWKSFISHPCFVKAHLKHSYHNDFRNPDFLHKRIGLLKNIQGKTKEVAAGSCNGLVCFPSSSTNAAGVQFVVINPCTRQLNKTTPFPPRSLLDQCQPVCQGFGYDSSSADDYKVIAGFTSEEEENQRILFYALTLKSNVWKLIAQVKYYMYDEVFGTNGILHGGALHWFMYDANKRLKIISLDLSTEEFKEIPQPTYEDYEPRHMKRYYEEHHCCHYELGVVEECLSICQNCDNNYGTWIWVMKNNKWGRHDVHYYKEKKKKDVLQHITHDYTLGSISLNNKPHLFMEYSIFVNSLVSPHPCVNNNDNYYEGHTMGIAKKRKKKRNKRKKRSWRSSSIFGSKKRFVSIPRSLDPITCSPMSKILIFMFVCLRLALSYMYI